MASEYRAENVLSIEFLNGKNIWIPEKRCMNVFAVRMSGFQMPTVYWILQKDNSVGIRNPDKDNRADLERSAFQLVGDHFVIRSSNVNR